MADLPPLPASKVLLGGRTLLLLPSLVGMVGLNEAIVLQQVRYRLGDDLQPRVREGRRWVRDPLERWRDRDFPFWEIDTLRRTFQSLEARGILISAQFESHLRDRTKWYTIDFDALACREREYRAIRAGTPPPSIQGRPRRDAGQLAADDRQAAIRANLPTPSTDRPSLPPIPASALLIDEPPLVIVVELATAIGLDEALILQQIRYWLADERKPHVRDGRRWVCPPEVDLFTPLAFRSDKTLARGLRALVRDGLLVASDRYNRRPGDRTKWYTIDFDRVAALAGQALVAPRPDSTELGPISQNASIQGDRKPVSSRTEYHQPAGQNAIVQRDMLRPSSGTESRLQTTNLPQSLTEPENDRETEDETEQHYGAVPTAVVASPDGIERAETMLRLRGVSPRVARRLAADFQERVAPQVAIYDWLRERDTGDERLTPGRLRRQIEEDWVAPVDYVSPAERAARAVAAERESRQRAVMVVTASRSAAVAAEERQAILDAIGLAGADQALWARIVQATPPLPPPFREALFHAPRDGEAAAIIFRDSAALSRATGPAHAATRARVATRVADLCRRPGAAVHYLAYDDVLALLRDASSASALTGSDSGSSFPDQGA
jgi:hypothetical protein